MNNNNIKTIAKYDSLINNKEFKRYCNSIRKLYNKSTVSFVYEKQVLLLIDDTMTKFKIPQFVILQVLGINSKTIGKYRKSYKMVLVATNRGSQNSLLNERVHFAKLIIKGQLTRLEVCTKSGYQYKTICNWVRDYKVFGVRMLAQAIAFRREL